MPSFIYRVQVRPCCNEPCITDLTFLTFFKAQTEFRRLLADEIKDGMPSGIMTLSELALEEETGEYVDNGAVKTVDFEDFDFEPMFRLKSSVKALTRYISDIGKVAGIDAFKPPEAYAEIIGEKLGYRTDPAEAELAEPAPRNSEYDHLPGRIMSSGGESQFVLLGYKDGLKIATIKGIREHVSGLSLLEVKKFVECASSTNPSVIDGLSANVVNALARYLANVAHYRVDYDRAGASEGMN